MGRSVGGLNAGLQKHIVKVLGAAFVTVISIVTFFEYFPRRLEDRARAQPTLPRLQP